MVEIIKDTSKMDSFGVLYWSPEFSMEKAYI